MIINAINCIQCSTQMPVARCLALYAVDYDASTNSVDELRLPWMPTKAVWCGACNAPTLAEDIRASAAWEDAFTTMRSGKHVEFPYSGVNKDGPNSLLDQSRHLYDAVRHRNDRGRCLCCGGYQHIDIDSPHLRHDACGGRFETIFWIGAAYYPRSAYKIFSTDGMLIGQLGRAIENARSEIEPFGYADIRLPEIPDTYVPGSS